MELIYQISNKHNNTTTTTLIMDAQTILNLVNKNLKIYLSDYYDNICNEIINNIHEKSDGAGMSIEKMKECAAELKPKIVNGDQQPEQPIAEQKKEKPIVEVNGSDIPDRSILSTMKRKDLQALCKVYKIPGRQKNSELIEQLMMKKVDAVDAVAQPVQELQPEPIAPEEPQPEPKVQKKSTKIIKVKKDKKKEIEIVKEPEPEPEPEELEEEPEQEEEHDDYNQDPDDDADHEDQDEEQDDAEEDPEDEDKWDDRFFAEELQEEEYDEEE